LEIGDTAGWKSAIQQVGNLRYDFGDSPSQVTHQG
jgi:hypothetical protein